MYSLFRASDKDRETTMLRLSIRTIRIIIKFRNGERSQRILKFLKSYPRSLLLSMYLYHHVSIRSTVYIQQRAICKHAFNTHSNIWFSFCFFFHLATRFTIKREFRNVTYCHHASLRYRGVSSLLNV